MAIEKIQTALKAPGISQKVANLSGIAPSTISRIARGIFPNPGILTVRRIEAALAQLARERKAGAAKSKPRRKTVETKVSPKVAKDLARQAEAGQAAERHGKLRSGKVR